MSRVAVSPSPRQRFFCPGFLTSLPHPQVLSILLARRPAVPNVFPISVTGFRDVTNAPQINRAHYLPADLKYFIRRKKREIYRPVGVALRLYGTPRATVLAIMRRSSPFRSAGRDVIISVSLVLPRPPRDTRDCVNYRAICTRESRVRFRAVVVSAPSRPFDR